MKHPEIEMMWIINLIKSPYTKTRFKYQESASKRQLEKSSQSSENNERFREWFNKMLKRGCFEYYCNKTVGSFTHPIETYIVNRGEFIKRLKEIDSFNKVYEISVSDYLSLKLS